jgi:hypothetical protein
LTLMPSYSFKMRGGLAITIFAVLALSAMVGGILTSCRNLPHQFRR